MLNGSKGENKQPLIQRATRSPLVRLILLGLVLGFAFQGTRGLWSPDEGRYAGGALQMLDSGNYLAPAYSSDRPNFSKPPMTYWIIAAAIKTFGRDTWAVRVPYAAAFVFTLWLLHAFGAQLIPERPWLPGVIYACALFPFLTANIVSTDVFLTLFEAIAMLGFLRWAFAQGAPEPRYLLLMWSGFGLAFLTKGPPGLIPLLAVLPFVVVRDGWKGLRSIFHAPGLAAFALIGLLWFAVVMLRYPWLPHYFAHQEIYQRLFTGAQRRHPGAFGWAAVYVPTLVLGSLPWWPLLNRKIRAVFKTDTWRRWGRERSIELFLALWLFVPLIVFCLSQSRLPLYILPLFIPLSLIVALALRDKFDLGTPRQRFWLFAWIIVLLAAKACVGYLIHPLEDNRLSARQLAALAEKTPYSSLVFLEDTAFDYSVEEQTPWGLRLYMNKPVYGIAWRLPEGPAEACRALRVRPALLVVDRAIDATGVNAALARCGVRDVIRLGSWRSNALELVQG